MNHFIRIKETPTTAHIFYNDRTHSVDVSWYDGTYLTSTSDFGSVFARFQGRGRTLAESMSDLYNAISLEIGLMAEAISEHTYES
jgi:hypothetical protein